MLVKYVPVVITLWNNLVEPTPVQQQEGSCWNISECTRELAFSILQLKEQL